MGITIKDAVKDIANKLEIKERDSLPSLSQWLYIFTKVRLSSLTKPFQTESKWALFQGYVSNLRSRRALPNDYWTADTVEDYMRCKVNLLLFLFRPVALILVRYMQSKANLQ